MGANNREHWLFRYDGYSAAHFHVNDDGSGSQENGPHQSVTKQCAGLGRENDLSQINKSTQRRHDSQRDAKKLFHNEEFAASSS